jgi:hypothetical protein
MGQRIYVVQGGSDGRNPDLVVAAQQTAEDLGLRPIIVRDVTQMVDAILARLNSISSTERISYLQIRGHGYPGNQMIGPGESGFPTQDERIIGVRANGELLNRTQLHRLSGRFERGAVVELYGCNVAQGAAGQQLLEKLAALWGGVEVRASDALQWHSAAQPLGPFQGNVSCIRTQKDVRPETPIQANWQ